MGADVSRILDGPDHYLYQGPWPREGEWRLLRSRADELRRLLVVVNMHWEQEVVPAGLLRPGDQLLWMNAIDGDFEALSLEWLRLVSMQVRAAVEAGCVTYVHCNAGISRSTLAVVGALMIVRDMTAAEALTFVRARRAIANPNPRFQALLGSIDARR